LAFIYTRGHHNLSKGNKSLALCIKYKVLEASFLEPLGSMWWEGSKQSLLQGIHSPVWG
jgi:hypothetical protein